jgi:hypothetical protein
VEVAVAYRKRLATKTGIPDWMTGPFQRLMGFDGREALQKDDVFQKWAQFMRPSQLRAVEMRWTEDEDGTRVSGVSPIIGGALVVWLAQSGWNFRIRLDSFTSSGR